MTQLDASLTHFSAALSRFRANTADHQVELVRPGDYGHWRFTAPGTRIHAVEANFWPGHMALTGDAGNMMLADSNIAGILAGFGPSQYSASKILCADFPISTFDERLAAQVAPGIEFDGEADFFDYAPADTEPWQVYSYTDQTLWLLLAGVKICQQMTCR